MRFLQSLLNRGRNQQSNGSYAEQTLRAVSGFDIVIPKTPGFEQYLEETSFVLDRAQVSEWQTRPGYSVGRFDSTYGNPISLALAGKVSQWIGRHLAERENVDADALAAAWYFPVWTEICTLAPLRHLARKVHAEMGDRRILLPIESPAFKCLGYWTYNDLEPLFLCAELRRRGANAFLYMRHSSDAPGRFRANRYHLEFRAHPDHWRSRTSKKVLPARADRVFSPEGLRNAQDIAGRVGPAETVLKSTIKVHNAGNVLWHRRDNPTSLRVSYRPTDKSAFVTVLAPKDGMPDIREGIHRLLGGVSAVAWQNANKLVSVTGAAEAHVCDHPFFESALVAHAVSAAGGAVHLWPHSTNAVTLPPFEKTRIGCANAITRTGQERWKCSLPADNVRTNSSILLKPPSELQVFDSGAPIHVVFFAGAHFMNRMPLSPYDGYTATIRSLFDGFGKLPKRFRVLIKPKTIWETRDWLSTFFPPEHTFEFTNQTTAELDLPNMVFLSASHGSSALIEGIGRGVPALVARDIPVYDYTSLNSASHQVGTVEFVIEQLRACEDKASFEELVAHNLKWFAEETSFPQDGQ